MLKSDRSIRNHALEPEMINPSSEKQVREGVISYGLSSYGDDLRVADEFKIFTSVNCAVVDPKNFDERSLLTMRSEVCHRPTQFIRISPLGGILQDSPRCSDDLRGQEHPCPLRHLVNV